MKLFEIMPIQVRVLSRFPIPILINPILILCEPVLHNQPFYTINRLPLFWSFTYLMILNGLMFGVQSLMFLNALMVRFLMLILIPPIFYLSIVGFNHKLH